MKIIKKPQTENEACRLIHELESEFNLHVIIWSPGDAIMKAEEMELEISKKEVEEIMYSMKKYHDANHGTTWESIEYLIEDIIRYRPDPRIKEFTLRIEEAEKYYKELIQLGKDDFTNKVKDNINRMKQQRAEIIAGRV